MHNDWATIGALMGKYLIIKGILLSIVMFSVACAMRLGEENRNARDKNEKNDENNNGG